jgi:hypothetical protein
VVVNPADPERKLPDPPLDEALAADEAAIAVGGRVIQMPLRIFH